MKKYLPLSLSVAIGFSAIAAASMAEEPVTLEPVELELAEAYDVSDDTIMPQVTVQGQQIQEDHGSYQPGFTRVGKTNQLPKDIPQSVTVITEQLMKDRSANTLKEALRNVAGITFNAGEGGRIGDNVTLRGYSAVGDMYLDGLRDMAQYNRDTFNLEQVEVLRGSASMLYGRGSTGGIINQVSKDPEPEDHVKLDLSGGTYRYMRGVLDVNRRLGKTLVARVNVMGTSANSFRQGAEQKRWGFAPSLTWGLGTKNEITGSYFFLRENNVPDFGVPYFNRRPLDVPVSRFYGMANYDFERNVASIASLKFKHRFNENHEINTIIRQGYYTRSLLATPPRFPRNLNIMDVTSDTRINREMKARGGTEKTLTAQTEYNGKFRTGFLEHNMLAGYATMWEKAKRWTDDTPYRYPSTTVGYPSIHPPMPGDFMDSFSRDQFNYYTGLSNSIYMQDTVQLIPHVKAMGGVRYDHMRTSYKRPDDHFKRNDHVWSYRGGLMYQPNDLSTYYVSYSSSFNPSAELYQLDQASSNTPPEKSRNMEAGAKWELFNGNMSLRTAVFRSEKTNERNTDLNNPTIMLLSGKRHTDGIELESAGRITKHWQVFSSVALMRSNIDKAGDSLSTNVGKRPANTPNYTYSVWSTYDCKFHGNWKFGAGLESVGQRYANEASSSSLVSIPAYRRVDAMVEYSRERYAIKLNLYNLLNTKYYEGIYRGHVVPGTSIAGLLTLSFKL